MTAPADDSIRNVVPRWRTFNATLLLGEMSPSKTAAHPADQAPVTDNLLALIRDFDATDSISIGGDALSAAISAGTRSHAIAVASKLVKLDLTAHPVVQSLALHTLTDRKIGLVPQIIVLDQGRVDTSALADNIRSIKKRLRLTPRNAFDWIDLGLMYRTLGQSRKADDAVNAARSIAPHDRFVLRCAARYYFDTLDYDQAHWLLTRAPNLQHDPWLLSAEIAIASLSGKSSRHIKRAESIIDRKQTQPFHVSELASALATINLMAGSYKRAKQYFRESLKSPTENAVAQASWADRHANIAASWQVDELPQTESHEAVAMQAMKSENWTEAISETYRWLVDQPFSTTPVINASFIYSAVFDAVAPAIEICRFGLRANPRDPAIRNNLAYALCMADRPDEAAVILDAIDFDSTNSYQQAVITATRGLVAYRQRDIEKGRQGYQSAVSYFENHSAPGAAIRARLLWAAEEMRLGNFQAADLADQIMKAAQSTSDLGLTAVMATIRRRIARMTSDG